MHVEGGCHCGTITYEADINPENVVICHCTDCQKLSGTAFRTVVFTEDENFDLKSGELKNYIKIAESGNERIQAFCPNCGSPIYATSVSGPPKMLGLRVGAINQRSELQPLKQIWYRSAQAWLGEISNMLMVEKQ